jgi:hypothetical protein
MNRGLREESIQKPPHTIGRRAVARLVNVARKKYEPRCVATALEDARRSQDVVPANEDEKKQRLAILTEARSLFLGQGYADTPVNSIAEAAGVEVNLVARLFKLKRTLLYASGLTLDQQGRVVDLVAAGHLPDGNLPHVFSYEDFDSEVIRVHLTTGPMLTIGFPRYPRAEPKKWL